MFDDLIETITTLPSSLAEAFKGLMDNPLSALVLVILLIALILVLRFGKIRFNTKMMTMIAISVAVAAVLNMIILYRMPMGGSVTLASCAPLFLVALAYGPQVGLFAGFLFGIVNFFLGPWIVHPIQVLLDYPIPFMLLGVAGAFPRRMNVGLVLGTTLRFLSHVVSGFVFFKEYAIEAGYASPLLYSLAYNATYLVPDLVIVILIMNLLPVSRLVKAINPEAPQISR